MGTVEAHLVLMPDGSLAEGCCSVTHGSHDEAWWEGGPCGACSYTRPTRDEEARLHLHVLGFEDVQVVPGTWSFAEVLWGVKAKKDLYTELFGDLALQEETYAYDR